MIRSVGTTSPLLQHNYSPFDGNAKLRSAVNSLSSAFAEILNISNYENADASDPSVSFALMLFSKYNNDLDFKSTMQFPISQQLSLQDADEYLYSTETPFLFSVFPPLPYLPVSCLTPSILEEPSLLKKRCLVGSSLLKYLISTTLYTKKPSYNEDQILGVLKSILNEHTLSILCRAYNIDFNHRFIGVSTKTHMLFLAYFGSYYDYNLSNNGTNVEAWNKLYFWSEKLLDCGEENKTVPRYAAGSLNAITVEHPIAETVSSAPESEAPSQLPSHSDQQNSNKKNPKVSTKEANEDIVLQEFIQSVQQDLNQTKTGSTEVSFEIMENPELKTGFFKCTISINNRETSSLSATSKKLAKSGAALLAAIDNSILQYIKRSYHNYWFRKYIDRKSIIEEKLSKDPRFLYVAKDGKVGSDSELVEHSNDTSRNSPNSAINQNSSLSTAKEKLYAYFNSKYNLFPKYEYLQLRNGKFEARLSLDDKEVSVAVGSSKKDASARAAMKVIEQNKDFM